MKKQTAVEWLVEQVNADCLNSTFIRPELIEWAKAMEREQIADAYVAAVEQFMEYDEHQDASLFPSEEKYMNKFYPRDIKK